MTQRKGTLGKSSQGPATQRQTQSRQEKSKDTPLSEKVIGAIGLLLVLCTVGYLLYESLQTEGPPEIVLTATNVIAQEHNYLVEVTVFNRGEQTVQSLSVTGTLVPRGTSSDEQSNSESSVVESNEITFDYVPHRSRRQGGIIFSHDPRQYDLKLEAGGYLTP